MLYLHVFAMSQQVVSASVKKAAVKDSCGLANKAKMPGLKKNRLIAYCSNCYLCKQAAFRSSRYIYVAFRVGETTYILDVFCFASVEVKKCNFRKVILLKCLGINILLIQMNLSTLHVIWHTSFTRNL